MSLNLISGLFPCSNDFNFTHATNGEYLRIIASLIPKELILEQTQEETVRWVINANAKAITEADWLERHGIDSPELLKLDN
jgi:hypothetical protein